MSTKFEEVFNKYMERIVSYNLAEKTNEDKIEDMISKLKTALGRFKLTYMDCDIEADYEKQEFNRELEPIEIDLLSAWMILEWVRPIILTEDKVEEYMTSTDYQISSSSPLLSAWRNIQKDLMAETSSATVLYGYKQKIKAKRKANANKGSV